MDPKGRERFKHKKFKENSRNKKGGKEKNQNQLLESCS